MNQNWNDPFGQQVVQEWNANMQTLYTQFGTFENYLAYRRQQNAQHQQYQKPTASPIGNRPANYISQLRQTPPGQQSQKPLWLQKRHQHDNAPQQQFGFGNQGRPTNDHPNFGALMGEPVDDFEEDYLEEAEASPATPADFFPISRGMPRIFRQAEAVNPSEVETSVLDVVFRFFLSLVMVAVDLITNVAFLTAPGQDPFLALGQSDPARWILGLGLVFSEYFAISYSRRVLKKGKSNIDFTEVLFVIALWVLVVLNFIATYLPLYNLHVGGEEIFSVAFALAFSMVIAFFSERFLTHLAELIKALRN